MEAQKRTNSLRPIVVIVGIIFFSYFSIIVIPYGFLDDYSVLCSALRHDTANYLAMVVEGGRPIAGLLEVWAFRACGSISDLGFLRAIGVSGSLHLQFFAIGYCEKHPCRVPWLLLSLRWLD